jgi:hypothetical protein
VFHKSWRWLLYSLNKLNIMPSTEIKYFSYKLSGEILTIIRYNIFERHDFPNFE